MNSLNYNINISNQNDNITENTLSYDTNTKDIYNNFNLGISSNNHKNHYINSQDNINNNINILYQNDNNKSLGLNNNIYEKISLHKLNDLPMSESNITNSTYDENRLDFNVKNISITPNNSRYFQKEILTNNNDKISVVQIKTENEITNEKKIVEAVKNIPLIRLYIFVKKLKSKCIFNILYQISYILNLFDLNKRKNFLNSLPVKLPKLLEKLLLINFPFKVIRNVFPDYNNYHIPSTPEIISPFLELIYSLSIVPGNGNVASTSNCIENNNISCNDDNKNEKSNSSKCSMSPLLLPQSELPCGDFPENDFIIQTPTTFLNNDVPQNNLETKQDFDISNTNNNQIFHNFIDNGNNINYNNKIINSDIQESPKDSYHLINDYHQINEPKSPLAHKNHQLHDNQDNTNNNLEDSHGAPYNFLANNMKLQSNLTLFPLSPYITLNNSDFQTDMEPDYSQKKPNHSDSKSSTNSSSPNFTTILNPSSSNTTTTLSTVAASIAALKSSSSSNKPSKSSLSKIEKKNLSKIKNSNIVKNIVKNFEEINNYYQNALLEAAEKTNTTRSSKRNSSKKYGSQDSHEENSSDSNNEDENNHENEHDQVLEEDKQTEEPEDVEVEVENIILSDQDKIRINEACDKMISESNFIHKSDLINIKESTGILNSYMTDFNSSNNDNDAMTEIIKDISLENNFNSDDSESNSEISNNIFNSLVNIEDLDITRLSILLIENFIKLSDVEKDEFLNSEYFDLIKSHVMNIQNDDEIEFSDVIKDPKMLNEFESHIEALQQCVKERDDIINYYYQEIVNERIQNEKLLVFCENEQLEREETNKIISGLSKKIEMEEDYIKKLEARCDMLIEKIKKYQSCCKHYEKSISLLSGNKSNTLKLINSQNTNNPPSFVPTAASMTSSMAMANASPVKPVPSVNVPKEHPARPGIANLIHQLNCEKISKNEEIQYLKSLLKSYNGKHIYLNESVIKRQIIEKTKPTPSTSIPATLDGVPVIPVSTNVGKDRSGKSLMMEKYLQDEKQLVNMEETIIVSDEENEEAMTSPSSPEEEDASIMNNGKSIDLSIIDDLNIFNEKHYQEKMLNKHHSPDDAKSLDKVPTPSEDDNFSEYAPTLVN